MRIADFILRDMEPITAQWGAFAATTLPAAEGMQFQDLREHVELILEGVATDLRTSQTREVQGEKPLGQLPGLINSTEETAAQTHGVLRARAGINVNQIAAEYCALRAIVLRRWMDNCAPDVADQNDLIRFNEAIDQALSESISSFNAQIEQGRNLLLGMLGHDMRSPLQAIQSIGSQLAILDAGEQVSQAASRLIRSGARMQALLDDLNELNRIKLGLGINVKPTNTNLAEVLDDELDELRAIHPDRKIELDVSGDAQGNWDGPRLQQLLGNLVLNAIKYGDPDTPVCVAVTGDVTHVHIDVINRGSAIETATLVRMFAPLKRGPQCPRNENEKAGSLGLGLYIASEIAKAHHGVIEARSDNRVTTLSVSLPRDADGSGGERFP